MPVQAHLKNAKENVGASLNANQDGEIYVIDGEYACINANKENKDVQAPVNVE